jgi:hypothetical protein
MVGKIIKKKFGRLKNSIIFVPNLKHKIMRRNVVVAGMGELSMGMGVENITQTPFIGITKLSKPHVIGESCLSSESQEVVTILFKNIESLEVLEKMCRKTRKFLELQNKSLPKKKRK